MSVFVAGIPKSSIIEFADDTTVITDNDETANREEVRDLACGARITTYPSM